MAAFFRFLYCSFFHFSSSYFFSLEWRNKHIIYQKARLDDYRNFGKWSKARISTDKLKIGKNRERASFAFSCNFFSFLSFLFLFRRIYLLEKTSLFFFLLFFSLPFSPLFFPSSSFLLFASYSPLSLLQPNWLRHLPFLTFLLPFLFPFFCFSSSPMLLQLKTGSYNSIFFFHFLLLLLLFLFLFLLSFSSILLLATTRFLSFYRFLCLPRL